MKPPIIQKQVRALIGLVNYYRDMWSRRSHLLHPLNALTSKKVNFEWTDMEKKLFYGIKHDVAYAPPISIPRLQ